MRVCENCRKELQENMISISVNIYGKLRATSNDISGLGNADTELDFCYEHGMKVVDLLRGFLEGGGSDNPKITNPFESLAKEEGRVFVPVLGDKKVS